MSWYQENREYVKAYARAYSGQHKAQRNEAQRAWRKRTRAERLIALDRGISLSEARKIVQQMDRRKAMAMHKSTYEYLKPTDEQLADMSALRDAARVYGEALDAHLPEGPDKTYVIRAHRTNAMWANVAITRLPDGTPRS